MSNHTLETTPHLYQSNRLEILLAAFCELLATPQPDPLAPEIVIVQNPGMGRWLSQQIALQTGISANLSFPLPASFFWEIFTATLGDLPELSAFERDTMLWRVAGELGTLFDHRSMTSIKSYLNDDQDGTKKFQLAEKITETFDQYLVYRPKMLLNWERGQDNHWQAILWRRLCEQNSAHRATLLKQFFDQGTAGKLHTANLPVRISLFGINSLAPTYLAVLKVLAPFVRIHIFHLSPCKQAWDDILPRRLLAIKRRTWRQQNIDDLNSYFTSGNPLLASLGATGQEFFSLLMEMELNGTETSLYAPPDSPTLLGKIQSDILELADRTAATQPQNFTPDNSIHFHCCHSRMREIQVLHDRLLDLFAADSSLQPADILVMAPDIGQYAPYVNGVFAAAEPHMRISWSIADQHPGTEQPVIDGFLTLLELLTSRFTAPEVMAFLENPAVLHSFALHEDDIPELRAFIRKAGIRFGLDDDLTPSACHAQAPTWRFGINRLLMGYCTGKLDEPCLDILPCATGHNTITSWLGNLTDFLQTLHRLAVRCQTPHTPERWQEILLNLVTDFFATSGRNEDQDALINLREKITDFAHHCHNADYTAPLPFTVVRHHFNTLLAQPGGGHAFLAGKVTFCNMVPMRSIPFKVIWLLGMNDKDYPRNQRPPAFDLIGQKPELGDRSRRDDDRYLFLESLLSARNHLVISWLGRDQQTNQPLPPSVVVAELHDYLDRGWLPHEEQSTNCDLLTTVHPLQPFSPKNFSPGASGKSYARLWLPTPCDREKLPFCPTPLPASSQCPTTISLASLCRFWNHPVKYFLLNRLGLNLYFMEENLPESELFTLDHLQSYQVNEKILPRVIAGTMSDGVFARLQAEGEFPIAGSGKIVQKQIITQAEELCEKVSLLLTSRLEPVPFEVNVAGYTVTGELSSLDNRGCISFRSAQCNGKDILNLWIHHLILNLIRPRGVDLVSFHVGKDKILSFPPIDQPEHHLEPLLRSFQQGQQEPLHFYPKTSYAWASAKEEQRMSKAKTSWFSHAAYNGHGEEDDLAYSIGLRGQNPLDLCFTQLAMVFFPILEAMEENNGTA